MARTTLRAQLDRVRRRVEERIDQGWALVRRRIQPPLAVEAFDGDVRFAVVTVNFSTSRWLALMLLTLGEQRGLDRVRRVVVVDNASRDDGRNLPRALAAHGARVSVIENRLWLSHGRGMRSGLRRLDALERALPAHERTNVVLFVDTDVVFRDETTLERLATLFATQGVAAAGELRHGLYPVPEAQASFLAVRRDHLARHDVAPWVDHGAPAYWLQRSLWRAGLSIADFPSNRGGFVLHRGRSGVAAAQRHHPRRSYGSASHEPHFMAIAGGAEIWSAIESRWAPLLADEPALVAHLATRFG